MSKLVYKLGCEEIDTSQLPGYDIILLLGQSNMTGQGSPIDPVLDAVDSRIDQFGIGSQSISPAADPLDVINAEIPDSLGLGLSLAKQYIADGRLATGRKILLVPASHGSTSFNSGFWRSGGTGYEAAVNSTNAAMQASLSEGVSCVVSMHLQLGESDMREGRTAQEFVADLEIFIDGMRSDVATANSRTPFVFGGYTSNIGFPQAPQYLVELADLPNRKDYTAFIPTNDLSTQDSLHFDAVGLRTLGQRHAAAIATAEANN